MIGRLHARGMIGTGSRSPQRGAPYTYVTTEQFLAAFDLETLQDLPDREQLDDAGMARAAPETDDQADPAAAKGAVGTATHS